MISLTSATKRAEEFAAAVDGRTTQDDLRAELTELVDVVGALRATAAPAPRPDFVASLREQLLAEASTALTRDASLTLPPRTKGSRERRLAVAATAFVLVGGTAGMAAAAQNALPGEALYPIKRGIESAQADLSRGQESKGQQLLEQADSRLTEVQGLLAEDATSTQVSTTLDTFVAQASEGSELLLGSFADEQDAATVDDVRDFTAAAMDSLEGLSALAPADLHSEFAEAAATLQQIDEEATAACTRCAEARPALLVPAAFAGGAAEAKRALAELAGARINNDHPTIGGIAQPDTGDAKSGPDKGSGSDSDTDGSNTSGGGADGDDPGSVLPDLGDTLDDVTGGGSAGASDGGLDQLTDGVKDTVRDVLPDDLDPALEQLLP